VVGGGNSGVDLATLLADAGAGPVHLSIRTPPTIMPLEIAGVPLQPLGVALRHLPERLKDASVRLLLPLALGDLSRFGLPPPPVGPFARLRTTGVTAAVDRGFVRHLRDGRVRVVADVERLAGEDVVLRGGERLRADVVVVTTGRAVEHLMPDGRMSGHRVSAGAVLGADGEVRWPG
jgi:cation diffusion facilitator CzcD-associated flavoprotein CzcO